MGLKISKEEWAERCAKGRKARKDQFAAADKLRADRAAAAVKIEKLERLANDAGAFNAEAENARHKASALKAKAADALKHPCANPLPRTVEEMLAHRKKKTGWKPAAARQAEKKAPLRIQAERAKHNDNENDNATKLENARLRARVAELEEKLARANETANETKPITKGNIGRPCKGDRPMTGYERVKAFRERQRAQ
jgi:hypothetical protein